MFAYIRSRWRRKPWQSLLFTASVVLVQCHDLRIRHLSLTSALSKSSSNDVSWVPIVRSSIFVILDFSDSYQTRVRPTLEQFWEFLLRSIFQVRKSFQPLENVFWDCRIIDINKPCHIDSQHVEVKFFVFVTSTVDVVINDDKQIENRYYDYKGFYSC